MCGGAFSGRMPRFAVGLLCLVLLLAPAFVPLGVAGAPAVKPLRVAVIDTGIDASHPEFRAGQVVAWKDFTAEASPTPKDGHGHGTATASLVAGLNNGNCGTGLGNQKLSFSPGADLVIARVGTDSGAISGSVTSAINWAVSQGADVISISIGTIVPFPIRGDAIRAAEAAGVVVVVSAGNGAGNVGTAPYPSWTSSYGNDPYALSVGGGSRSGGTVTSTTGNSDPDVTSWSDSVCVARANVGTYGKMSGTSFSAPLVAGMAGGAIDVARQNGQSDDPVAIKTLLKRSATNNPISPYHREGLGFLLMNEWFRVQAHAAAGTLPDYDAQGAHALADRVYHEEVMDRAKRANLN